MERCLILVSRIEFSRFQYNTFHSAGKGYPVDMDIKHIHKDRNLDDLFVQKAFIQDFVNNDYLAVCRADYSVLILWMNP